jgi:putative Mg2+ transporter-C (MgtC) family protein
VKEGDEESKNMLKWSAPRTWQFAPDSVSRLESPRVKWEFIMHWLTFTANIVAALIMGGAIGLERQWRQRTAGLRTNALVALGAALFVSLSLLMDHEASPTRIAAQVVSGLGFLGGGVILREGLNVRGMNTAATIWCSGAVGTLAGAGFPLEAAIGTVAVLGAHVGLRPLVRRINVHAHMSTDVDITYRVRVTCPDPQEPVIRAIFLRHINSQPNMTLQGLATQETEDKQRVTVVADVYASERNDRILEQLVSRIGIEPGVTAVSWERTPHEP